MDPARRASQTRGSGGPREAAAPRGPDERAGRWPKPPPGDARWRFTSPYDSRLLIPADPPDDAGLRDLHERAVISAARVRRAAEFWRAMEHRARVALAEVAHRAVIDEVERAVRAEHRRVRPVDAAQRGRLDERLIVVLLAAGCAVGVVELIRLLAVEREPRLLEAEPLTGRLKLTNSMSCPAAGWPFSFDADETQGFEPCVSVSSPCLFTT